MVNHPNRSKRQKEPAWCVSQWAEEGKVIGYQVARTRNGEFQRHKGFRFTIGSENSTAERKRVAALALMEAKDWNDALGLGKTPIPVGDPAFVGLKP